MYLRSRILAALRLADPPAPEAISSNFVFEHPTLHDMAVNLASLVGQGQMATEKIKSDVITSLLERYSSPNLSKTSVESVDSVTERVVLLTGSTGYLGSHILAALLADARIAKVFTLNRTGTFTPDRKKDGFAQCHLPTDLLSQGKLVQLTGDISQPDFGLQGSIYNEVCPSHTHPCGQAY